MDKLWTDHKLVIKGKNEEIRLADAAGYKRGVDHFIAKRLGGENGVMEYDAAVSPFPYETTELADLEPGVSSRGASRTRSRWLKSRPSAK